MHFVLGLVRVPVTLLPVFLVDRIGRRPLIVGSAFISFVSLILMMVSIDIGPSWKVSTTICKKLTLIYCDDSNKIFEDYFKQIIPNSSLILTNSKLLRIISIQVGTFVGLALLLLINTCGIGSVSRFYSAELVPRHLLLSSVATLTMFESISKIAVEFAFYPVANVVGL